MLRRVKGRVQQVLTCGNITLNETTRGVIVDEEPIILSQAQFALLSTFMRHPNQVLTRYQLISLSFDYEFDGFDRAIDSQVARLRKRIGQYGSQPIQTVYGAGYELMRPETLRQYDCEGDEARFWPAVWGSARPIMRWLALALVLEVLLQRLVPDAWVVSLLGTDALSSVPLAVFVGAPIYLDGYTALPPVRRLMEMGMGFGAALAFMISGAAVSLYAAAAVISIVRARVFMLYILLALSGACLAGYIVNWILYRLVAIIVGGPGDSRQGPARDVLHSPQKALCPVAAQAFAHTVADLDQDRGEAPLPEGIGCAQPSGSSTEASSTHMMSARHCGERIGFHDSQASGTAQQAPYKT